MFILLYLYIFILLYLYIFILLYLYIFILLYIYLFIYLTILKTTHLHVCVSVRWWVVTEKDRENGLLKLMKTSPPPEPQSGHLPLSFFDLQFTELVKDQLHHSFWNTQPLRILSSRNLLGRKALNHQIKSGWVDGIETLPAFQPTAPLNDVRVGTTALVVTPVIQTTRVWRANHANHHSGTLNKGLAWSCSRHLATFSRPSAHQ